MKNLRKELLEEFREQFLVASYNIGGKFTHYGVDEDIMEDATELEEWIDQAIERVERETLESLKGNVIGLFPINRIDTGDKYTSKEIIERIWSFIEHRLALQQKEGDK